MRSPILSFFYLVLRATFDLTPDAIYESLKVTEILPKEGLELNLDYRDCPFTLVTTLVLSPTETDISSKKRGFKRGAVRTSGSGCFKMVLTLLTEIIAVHVRFSIVQVRNPGFERALSRSSLILTLDGFHIDLHKLMKIFIGILVRSGGRSGKRSGKRSGSASIAWAGGSYIAWGWSSFWLAGSCGAY